jgi:hypothetical protein
MLRNNKQFVLNVFNYINCENTKKNMGWLASETVTAAGISVASFSAEGMSPQ